jgi:hypothetical protein
LLRLSGMDVSAEPVPFDKMAPMCSSLAKRNGKPRSVPLRCTLQLAASLHTYIILYPKFLIVENIAFF